ncbi:hypothetical protein SRHO_G00275550 [Serrasalmus rhombeus]
MEKAERECARLRETRASGGTVFHCPRVACFESWEKRVESAVGHGVTERRAYVQDESQKAGSVQEAYMTKRDGADPQQGADLHARVALSAKNYRQLGLGVKGPVHSKTKYQKLFWSPEHSLDVVPSLEY